MKDRVITEFNESFNALGLEEAIQEAKRCRKCEDSQCVKSCPIGIDIPGFIHALSMGNIGEARKIIDKKSNLPSICGRICALEKQCEGSCIEGSEGGIKIQIGQLERFVADFAYQLKLIQEDIPSKTRGRIAVIGSGPAGLTAAADLSKAGFLVTVFESLPESGGVLLYGIPEFRLPKEVVRREIRQMEAIGVNFINNAMAGKDFTVESLMEQGYDSVFIGSGTAVGKELPLPGNELNGIIQSSYLLRMISLYNSNQSEKSEIPVKSGDRTVIIGCGNVAMDASRSLLRMGAKSVTIVSRDTKDKMPALKAEYKRAVSDGVEFLWENSPVRYSEGENNSVDGLIVEVDGTEKKIDADKIYLAVGSRPANRIVTTTKGIDVDENGYVITKEKPYGLTTKQGVFAGGDVVHRPATVVLAMKDAKKVANAITEYVDAKKLLDI